MQRIPSSKNKLIAVLACILIVFANFSIFAIDNTNIASNKRIYSLGGSWWDASKAIDGVENASNSSDTWLSENLSYSALYIDLESVYDISRIELVFPGQMPNTNGEYLALGEVQCNVETVEGLVGTVSGSKLVIDESKRLSILDNGYIASVWTGIVSKTNTTNNVLSITSSAVKTRYLRVRINNKTGLKLAALTELKIYGSLYVDPDKNVQLKSIMCDNVALSQFNMNVYDYNYTIENDASKCPVVNASALASGASVSIQQADMTSRKATINVTSKDKTATATYTVSFVSEILVSRDKYNLSYVYAYEPASNAIDGDLKTKWKAFSDWGCMFIDLGAVYDLSSFKIVFGDVATGTWTYKIDSMIAMPPMGVEGSTVDNQDYLAEKYVVKNIFSGTSTTNTPAKSTISAKSRYVRLIISGNTAYSGDGLCVVDEFEIYAQEAEFDARLRDIKIDGQSLDGFSSDTSGYFYKLQPGEGVKAVSAQPMTNGAGVTITQAVTVPGRADIVCVSKDKTQTQAYSVFFIYENGATGVLTDQKKPVGYNNPQGEIPGFAFDGDYTTVWNSGGKTAALFIDLKGLYHISLAQLNFIKGNQENYKFRIDKLSALPDYRRNTTGDIGDSLVMQTIYDGSSKSLPGNDLFMALDSTARYVRLLVTDCQINIGIKEFTLYGYGSGTSDANLGGIQIDGKGISEFNKDFSSYFYPLALGTQTIPVVTVTRSDANQIVQITQAESTNGAAKIVVTSSDLSKSTSYMVFFREQQSAQEKIISTGKAVKATSSAAGGNPSYLTDGNMRTIWKSENKGYTPTVTIDLGKKYFVTAMNSIVSGLTGRDVVAYAIDISSNGTDYIRAYSSDSDLYKGGNLLSVINKTARYLKITYFGVHGYRYAPMNINELVIYGEEREALVSSIMVDGIEIKDFIESVNQYTYSYNASKGLIPNFSVKTAPGVSVEVKKATSLSGKVIINVTKGQTIKQYVYILCPSGISIKGKGYYLQYKDFSINDK
jgi:hypothetical protein